MCERIEVAGEHPLDPGAAKFTGRQADAVHDDQVGHHPRRPWITMRREHLADLAQQASERVNADAVLHDAAHDAKMPA